MGNMLYLIAFFEPHNPKVILGGKEIEYVKRCGLNQVFVDQPIAPLRGALREPWKGRMCEVIQQQQANAKKRCTACLEAEKQTYSNGHQCRDVEGIDYRNEGVARHPAKKYLKKTRTQQVTLSSPRWTIQLQNPLIQKVPADKDTQYHQATDLARG